MPREVEAARLPRLALTLHLREALAVEGFAISEGEIARLSALAREPLV